MSRRKPQRPNQPARRPAQNQSPGQFVSIQASYEGPLPLPEILARYDDIVPGAAERIIALAEDQAHHRMSLEATALKADAQRADRGLIAGFIIAVLFLAAAVGLTMSGYEVVGGVLGTFDIVGLAGAFIYGSKTRKEERQHRANLLAGGQQGRR